MIDEQYCTNSQLPITVIRNMVHSLTTDGQDRRYSVQVGVVPEMPKAEAERLTGNALPITYENGGCGRYVPDLAIGHLSK
jgi:hypothetical protein